jgi:CDP-glucose 4,6-dehydratase
LEGLALIIARLDPTFWHKKRVLVTGHSGFKGTWLVTWLQRLGATVYGLSLPPNTNPNLFNLLGRHDSCVSRLGDIRDYTTVLNFTKLAQPEIVFHLAAQPLVRESYKNPVDTYATNVMGTVHVLNALKEVDSTKVAICVTTDKVYANNNSIWPCRESDPLGGYDPYSASKAASEMVVDSYKRAFLSERGLAVATARAGNVIGGGDWSSDRLIPDAVRAWQAGDLLSIRRPDAVRPWQHVLDPLFGYLSLVEKLWSEPTIAGPYNFGPASSDVFSVRDVVGQASMYFPNSKIEFSSEILGPHESEYLSLEIAKAKKLLNFAPRWSISRTIEQTMHWYMNQHAGKNALDLCIADIEAYEGT